MSVHVAAADNKNHRPSAQIAEVLARECCQRDCATSFGQNLFAFQQLEHGGGDLFLLHGHHIVDQPLYNGKSTLSYFFDADTVCNGILGWNIDRFTQPESSYGRSASSCLHADN